MKLAPQLAFNGNCREAFEHYAKLFGGEITVMNTFGGNEDHKLPPGSEAGPSEKIRFAELRFGDNMLRGNDVNADTFKPMEGFNLSLHIDSSKEAHRIFDELSQAGSVSTPLAKVDWADLFGMVKDRSVFRG